MKPENEIFITSSISIVSVGNDTNLTKTPCVSLRFNNKTIDRITLIKLREYTVAEPCLLFQVGGGLGCDDLHFYDEPNLYEAYKKLKAELEHHGIKFEKSLTD